MKLTQVTALKIKHNPFAKAFLDSKERSNGAGVGSGHHHHPGGGDPSDGVHHSMVHHAQYSQCKSYEIGQSLIKKNMA